MMAEMDFGHLRFLESIFDETGKLIDSQVQCMFDDLKAGKHFNILNSPEIKELQACCSFASVGDPSRVYADAVASLLSGTDNELYMRRALSHLFIAIASLDAFTQSNVTGPVLNFDAFPLLFPSATNTPDVKVDYHNRLIKSLTVDGSPAYHLTPHVELFAVARQILNSPELYAALPTVVRWARMRVNVQHQRLLDEIAETLETLIFADANALAVDILTDKYSETTKVEFLLEKAAICELHGHDKQARKDLEAAAKLHGFDFVLTGRLGKRTKFQAKDISQLVVLAKSRGDSVVSTQANEQGPENIDLNDDTLLDSISFRSPAVQPPSENEEVEDIPSSLSFLNPSSQPQLHSLDSTILLLWASSITNTSPQHGLTREETLPYATRVLQDGSSNWQVYTQALLVRSRIEGYKSRTVERGVLQLQALVDQVIAETTSKEKSTSVGDVPVSSFLPAPKPSESAAASVRLRYVYLLLSPTRWDMEAELAARWVNLGALRTALTIYERLEMWAEAALCCAATDREDQAKRILREQLYQKDGNLEKEHLPPNAPRLFCILGDLLNDPKLFERAWDVSAHHYGRAQRSLGRHYVSRKEWVRAAEAYRLALHVYRQDHATWFDLGCVSLQLEQYDEAVEAFTRTVQIDDTDAEAWSNLAAALLRLPDTSSCVVHPPDEKEEIQKQKPKDKKHLALHALVRASSLAHSNPKIHANLLTVASQCRPPSLSHIISAQSTLLTLTNSESSIDIPVLELSCRDLLAEAGSWADVQSRGGAKGNLRLFLRMLDGQVAKVATREAQLWRLLGRVDVWRERPAAALECNEKAWRCIVGDDIETESNWETAVDATLKLCDDYEKLGQQVRESGLGAGSIVCKEWRFKSRSAVRGLMSRGRDLWEGTDAWIRLQQRMDHLKLNSR